MSEKKARYVGALDEITLTVPVSTEGEPDRHIRVKQGGELPTEVDGHKIPASVRDNLLEQKDNWTLVNRATGNTTSAKADEKGA